MVCATTAGALRKWKLYGRSVRYPAYLLDLGVHEGSDLLVPVPAVLLPEAEPKLLLARETCLRLDRAQRRRLVAPLAENGRLTTVAQVAELGVDLENPPRPLQEGADLGGDKVLGEGHVVGVHDELVDEVVAEADLLVGVGELIQLVVEPGLLLLCVMVSPPSAL